jgi:long-subunit fatty acid transport protein
MTGASIVTVHPARIAAKALLVFAGFGMAGGSATAQAIWLPGSDPVNIARSGTGVAFGRSIEACSINPAILPTLQPKWSFYLSGGMEMQSTQLTLPSNERVLYTSDRNRFLPGFGIGWRALPKLAIGLRVDTPFLRHSELPKESSSRFFGQAVDLKAQRAELQIAGAVTDAFSVGASVGLTFLDYASTVALRALVPSAAASPVGESNPAEALLETAVRQEGSVSAVSFGAGFRYAVNSRWTVGGSYRSGAKGRPDLVASVPSQGIDIYNTRGFNAPPPPIGIEDQARVVRDASTVRPGAGDIVLPYRVQLGVRHRFNQMMTWEIDLHYIGSSALEMPMQPEMDTPSGPVATIGGLYEYEDGIGVSGMLEVTLGRDWVARCGFSQDPGLRSGGEVDAMLGGSKSAGFSVGGGYRVLGGELCAGYQYRQAMDRDTNGMEGIWSASGLRSSGTLTRIEGMGHIWSVGFRKSF